LQYLLGALQDIKPQFYQANKILLLTDFDGTLTPIVARPEQVILPDSTRHLLKFLANQKRLKLGVISGRSLTDLKEKVNIDGIIYAGNHGFEIEGLGLNFVNPLVDEIRPFFRSLYQWLIHALEPAQGVFVENKGITLSVHYRQMDEEKTPDMFRSFNRVVHKARGEGRFKVTSGKKVYELRPDVDWDKGKAISLLIRKFGSLKDKDLFPVYLGDDITDEDGFAAIQRYGKGLTVHIGNNLRQTGARYYLKSPDEVIQFLKILRIWFERRFK
jgi:trehalose-phosphatase